MLHFDPDTGLYADEITDVREEVRAQWVAAFQKDGRPELNTEPETPAGQLIDSQTAAIVQKDAEVLYLGNMFNPLTASGIWQDALAKIYFLTRKDAQASEAACTCTGLRGTVIAQGAVIQSTADGTQWACAEAVTIPATGTVTARFVAQDTGAIEASAGTLTQIVTVTPGWDTVTNTAAATVGFESESQAAFELRRYNSVAKNARGSLNAIYGAIADLDDVSTCLVLENTGNETITLWGVEIPGHSVWITVVGGDDTEIAETIYRKKDAGCGTAGGTEITFQDTEIPGSPIYTYQICRPTPLAVALRVIIKVTSNTLADIEDRVKDAVIETFNGLNSVDLRVGPGQEVYASRFYCPIISAGATSLVSVEIGIKGGSYGEMITVNADQSPVLDREDITVVLVTED